MRGKAGMFHYKSSANLLLDTYTGAGLAFSVRKLRTAYAGYCMRVRRSSDNTEQDIGFTAGGDLDESAITTFCGAGSGYVRTWYDQSGNGYNMTIASDNMRICNAGTIEKINSKPIIVNLGGSFYNASVAYNKIFGSSQHYSIASIKYSGVPYMWATDDGLTILQAVLPGSVLFVANTAGVQGDDTVTSGNQAIYEAVYQNSTTLTGYTNGVEDKETYLNAASYAPSGTVGLYISGFDGSDVCDIQEVIIYPSNKSSSRSAIYTNVNAYF